MFIDVTWVRGGLGKGSLAYHGSPRWPAEYNRRVREIVELSWVADEEGGTSTAGGAAAAASTST
jgi:hypothetical protein